MHLVGWAEGVHPLLVIDGYMRPADRLEERIDAVLQFTEVQLLAAGRGGMFNWN